jgi:hypothetical protein
MANRNRALLGTCLALVGVCAIAACSGTASSPSPGALPGGMQAGTSADGHGALPGNVQNPYPTSTGYTLKYAYSQKVVAQPSSAPQQISSQTGSLVDTIEGSAVFDGVSRLDSRSVLNFTYSNDNGQSTGSTQKTTDDYQSFDQNGAQVFYDLYGLVDSGTSTDSTGASTVSSDVETYDAPFILDELPETAGVKWVTGVGFTASSSSQTTLNGSVTSQSVTTESHGSDGSYMTQVTTTNPKGTYEIVKTQNADGSGQETDGGTGKQAGLTQWGTPSISGGKYVIPVTHTPPNGKPTTTNVPDWYPGNGKIRNLFSDETKDISLEVPVPKICGRSTAQRAAVKLEETTSLLDVVNGSYKTTETDRYVIAGVGVVCTVHDRTTASYDNFASGVKQRSEHETTVSGLKKF